MSDVFGRKFPKIIEFSITFVIDRENVLYTLFVNYNNELCKNGRSWYPAAKLENLSGFKGKALMVYMKFP